MLCAHWNRVPEKEIFNDNLYPSSEHLQELVWGGALAVTASFSVALNQFCGQCICFSICIAP